MEKASQRSFLHAVGKAVSKLESVAGLNVKVAQAKSWTLNRRNF